MTEPTQQTEPTFGPSPSRAGALVDIVIYLAAAAAFWGLEELMRGVNVFPFPGLFDGGITLVLSFFVVVGLMKWRGQGWGDLGLKKPARW